MTEKSFRMCTIYLYIYIYINWEPVSSLPPLPPPPLLCCCRYYLCHRAIYICMHCTYFLALFYIWFCRIRCLYISSIFAENIKQKAIREHFLCSIHTHTKCVAIIKNGMEIGDVLRIHAYSWHRYEECCRNKLKPNWVEE